MSTRLLKTNYSTADRNRAHARAYRHAYRAQADERRKRSFLQRRRNILVDLQAPRSVLDNTVERRIRIASCCAWFILGVLAVLTTVHTLGAPTK